MKTKTYKEYKMEIRKQIHGELRKEFPNMELVKTLYKKIENLEKPIEKIKEEKKKHAKPKGRDSSQYVDVGITFEQYRDLKIYGFRDYEIAKLCYVGTAKMCRCRKEWEINHRYNLGSITEEQYVNMRKNGLSLNQICENTRMDRSSLYAKRKKWGRLNDYYNFRIRKRKGEK